MKIPASLYWRTKSMMWFKPLYKTMGDLETLILQSELKKIQIKSPIYITSLARSGTTIITEMLSQGADICSHTYGDFPGVFTPYWKNWLRQKQKFLSGKKVERSHGDRIMVNNDSPDAFEEVLWMYFFSELHNNQSSGDYSANRNFVNYYKNNIKKHLLVKNKSQYIAKANYNISRIESLLKIFPDAKFIIPIRHPINHIASLVKQHKIYIDAAKANPKIDSQLAASGHFEFGNIRQIVDMPHSDYHNVVSDHWKKNQEIRGWASYWNGLYSAVFDLKNKSKTLSQAIHIIKYEDLCNNSLPTIDSILRHCNLDLKQFESIKSQYNQQLSLPNYYKIPFDKEKIDEILTITKTASLKFGYNADNYN
ncbi:MAG: sulfotransferase [Marinicellaceae bacterium]